MGTRARPKALGSGGALISALWGVYSALTTAKDIPEDAGWLAKMLADPPVYLPWLAAAICISVVIWAFWWPSPPDDDSVGSGQNPVTHGPNAPAIVGGGNTIHFHAAPPTAATTQERKDPPGPTSPKYNIRNMDALLRAVSGDPPPPQPRPLPDFPLAGVLSRVAKTLPKPNNDAARAEFHRKINRAIADAVVTHHRSTWGYYRDRPIHQIDWHEWKKATFNHRDKGSLSIPTDAVRPMVYRELKFNKEEIDAIWPPN